MNLKIIAKAATDPEIYPKASYAIYNLYIHIGGFFQHGMKSGTLAKGKMEKNSFAAFTTIFGINKSVHRNNQNLFFLFFSLINRQH